ncbi:MAG: hypothetical protein AAGB11_14955 [Pseudomonadota bacterium]
MSVYEQDFATLAKAMQNFFDAVDWRTDVTVQSAAAEAEAIHGDGAAIHVMVRACDHLRDGEPDDCEFWMKVYGLLISPEPSAGGQVTLH